METCPGCGAELAAVDGPTDPYGGASPSCWAMFAEVCAKDFGEYGYPDVHRSIVDAYMAQHPSFATPAGRRSVAVHLVGLYCTFEERLSVKEIVRILAEVFPDKRDVLPFAPVPPSSELTIASVYSASNELDHSERATAWARAVWRAWAPHHSRVRELFLARARSRPSDR